MRPRVAHIATVDLSLRSLLLPQLLALREAGFDVTGISAAGPWVAELEALGIRHIPWTEATRAWNPRADVAAFVQLLTILRRERFDLVHTHNPKPGVLGRIAARVAGVPSIINTVHGFYATPEDRPQRRVPVLAAEWIAARFSDLELYQSSEDLVWARRLHIVRRGRSVYLGNGIDLSEFKPDRGAEERVRKLRAELGIAEDELVVGAVGRMVMEKGWGEFFEASHIVRARVPNVRFLAVGERDGDKSDAVSSDVLAKARQDIVFTGWREDIADLMALMDVFVLPSWREGLPRSAIEAAASGLPLVLTDIRGCREVARDRVEGSLVAVRDAPALANAIAALLEDPEARRQFGRAARARAEELFDERRVMQTVVGASKALLARQPMRSERVTGYDDLKRVFDVAVAGSALVILSPIMGAVAIGVRLGLGKRVLFRQERPGLHSKPFTIFKFRSMLDLRDPSGELLSDGDRLTPLGRVLRATSVDELPELWNVVRGDMSLVGPRPLLMRYVDRYSPQQTRRHDVRPGITGWAQVHGRNALDWDQRLALDVWYVDHRSFAIDLKILLKTVRLVLRRVGIRQPGSATVEEFTGTP